MYCEESSVFGFEVFEVGVGFSDLEDAFLGAVGDALLGGVGLEVGEGGAVEEKVRHELPDMGLEIPVALLYVAQFRKDALAHCQFQITIENTGHSQTQRANSNITFTDLRKGKALRMHYNCNV